MNSERVHQDYLEDILDSIEKVARFIQGMTYEQFAEDDKTTYAVIRALESLEKLPSIFRNLSEITFLRYPGERWLEYMTS